MTLDAPVDVLPSPDPADVLPLPADDLAFLNEYMSNGGNATQAYRAVHPRTSYAACRVAASRLLDRPDVQHEIARRLHRSAGIDRQFIEDGLLTQYRRANTSADYVASANILMDCAKLAGLLVEKRQDLTERPLLTADISDRLVLILQSSPQLRETVLKRLAVSQTPVDETANPPVHNPPSPPQSPQVIDSAGVR